MAYDLSSLISKVQKRVRDTGFSTANITDYLNDTQNDVFNEYKIKFMRTSQNYTTTSGVADITNGSGLPTTLDQVIELIDTTAGQEQTIDYMDIEELGRLYPDPIDTALYPNGQPLYWYMDAQTIKLFPAPSGAFTLTLRFWKKPAELVDGDDVPEVPSNFQELLVRGASARVLQEKDNYDQAAIHENKYEEQLQKFVVRYSVPQSGKVTIMPTNKRRMIEKSTTRWR